MTNAPSTHAHDDPNENSSPTKNCSVFDTNFSRMDPLPQFSPFEVPQFKHFHLNNEDDSPILRCEESPLAVRTKKRITEGGKMNLMAQSIFRSRVPQSHHESTFLNTSVPPKTPPPSTSIVDASIYMTPEVSIVEEEDHKTEDPGKILLLDDDQSDSNHASEDRQKHTELSPIQDNSCEIDLNARYRILASFADNLTKDLSIKNKLIQVLQADRDQAHKDRDEAERKMMEMREKLQQAALEQKSKRNQQVHKIASIVHSLTSEVEAVMSKCDQTSPEDTIQLLSLKEVHHFQNHLKSGKLALEDLHEILDQFRNSNIDLEARNSQQAKKIKAYEKELAILRQQSSDPPGSDHFSKSLKDYSEDNQSAHPHVTHSKIPLSLSSKIASLSNKLSVTSLYNQNLEDIKQNIRMLEEEAATMAELRSKSDNLQNELESTKRALETAEHGRSEALEEVQKLREEMKTIQEKHLSDQRYNLQRLTESQDKFNQDRKELMLKLKTSNQQIEELKLQLLHQKSPCLHCQSHQIYSNMLEDERNRLRNKLAEIKIQLAEKEVQITRLRKIRNELKQDIEGLNIALEAKQQENSYLKRERVVRQTDLLHNSTSLRTNGGNGTMMRRTSSSMMMDRTITSNEQKSSDATN